MYNKFGERLKGAIKKAGYTNAKATQELGLSKNTISNYINKNVPETVVAVHKLAELCNVTVDYLLTGKENKSELNDDEKYLIELYRILNNKNKIKAEGELERLNSLQEQQETLDKLSASTTSKTKDKAG
ncbi:helix-turn-helix domain-containing protein [Vallitalea okinawensis]|uniref:helix-turn-helix domain-containing protein n=1 Tax=Vallitalea okinawensis TaxID=2078660 RepID=UPI000CFD6796|nr:helix-turn-helix transcriptional regulator [Vallitalea okinawensis]